MLNLAALKIAVLSATVPVPDVPPAPGAYAMSGASILGLVVCGGGMVAFVVMVLVVMRSPDVIRRRGAQVMIAAFLAVGLGGLGLAYLTDRANHRDVNNASAAWGDARQVAQRDVAAQLEQVYGVTFTELAWQGMPVEDGLYGSDAVTFSDGHVEECFTVAEEGVVDLRCGADSYEDATPVDPVG